MSRPSTLALLSSLLLVACGGGGADFTKDDNPGKAASVSLSPANTGDGWTTSTPAAEGLSADKIQSVFDSIRNGVFPGVDSMVVVRNQKLVAEGYFNGYDA